MRIPLLCLAAALFAALPAATEDPEIQTVAKTDFSEKQLSAEWALTSTSWGIEEGEMRGKGPGVLFCTKSMEGDFKLTMNAWMEQKANVEIQLIDPKTDAAYFTFVFMGKYHSVLDGVKSAILKDNNFVSIDPKMWIFPGRMFSFEVRREGNEFQMFLDHELGPYFVDDKSPSPMKDFIVRISILTEGVRDKVRMDDVVLTAPKKK